MSKTKKPIKLYKIPGTTKYTYKCIVCTHVTVTSDRKQEKVSCGKCGHKERIQFV